MIRKVLQPRGYQEFPIRPFPPDMEGKTRYFSDLPYLVPEHIPFMEKSRMITNSIMYKARAEYQAGFAARVDAENRNWGKPQGVGLERSFPERQAGSVFSQKA